MCGIAGVFCVDGRPIDPLRVERMCEAMVFRGPDGYGLSRGRGFVLGHRRLAIIDLSEAARQPMISEDGAIQVVLNGEIYNFRELRERLEATGYRFVSRSDTEVLIHGYREWGLNGILSRIRGMYAFALVDTRCGEIHLARDPLGEKPLFFRWGDGELAFASSARALVLGLTASPEVDATAIDDLLWHLYVPGSRTIFTGVEKLLPGHASSFGPDGERRDHVHWRPDFFHPEHGVDDEEWIERVEATLRAAIRRQLVADVPVGIMLSGGIDSGLVTALAARSTGRVQTFSVATDDPALDESRFSRAVAERYGTDHHVLQVRSNVRQDLPRLVAAMSEPLGDAAAMNLFAISRVAREAVTVVLTGEGGDECFGGYSYFLAYYLAGLLGVFPAPVRAPLAVLGKALRYFPGGIRRAGTLLHIAAAPTEKTFSQTSSILDASTRTDLYGPTFAEALRKRSPISHHLDALASTSATACLPVDRVMQTHLRTILADDFLPKADIGTMAASLEARSPFLDLEVVELAMRIPAAVRFSGNKPKGLLRRLARRHLPIECVARRKQGFSTPMALWLKDWRDLLDDLVLGPQVERRGWFRRKALQDIVEGRCRAVDRGQLIWTLMVLELWMRITAEVTTLPLRHRQRSASCPVRSTSAVQTGR